MVSLRLIFFEKRSYKLLSVKYFFKAMPMTKALAFGTL